MRATRLLTVMVLFFVFLNLDIALSKNFNPALADLKELSVTLKANDTIPDTDVFKLQAAKTDAVNRLTDSGFKISQAEGIPELNINLSLLKIESCGQYIIFVQTSLIRDVKLPDADIKTNFSGQVWKTDSGLKTVSIDDVPAQVNSIVQQHIKAFISNSSRIAYDSKSDVNQSGRHPRKANVEKNTKTEKQQETEVKFVGSRNSEVFHKAGCPSAKRISEKNLVAYNSKEDAVNAGKRPCGRCNPQ